MDDDVIDEVLGQLAPSTGRAGRSRPAASRSTATCREPVTRVLRTRAELRGGARRLRRRPVGLVPTMGWLHDGHRSLIRRARADEPDGRRLDLRQPPPVQPGRRLHAVPAQRGPRRGDLRGRGRRPRLGAAGRRGLPAGLRHDRVSVGAIAGPLEGAARPGHFDGVATVVAILFGAGRRRARLLRPEGRPAGHGDPADGPRPGPADAR